VDRVGPPHVQLARSLRPTSFQKCNNFASPPSRKNGLGALRSWPSLLFVENTDLVILRGSHFSPGKVASSWSFAFCGLSVIFRGGSLTTSSLKGYMYSTQRSIESVAEDNLCLSAALTTEIGKPKLSWCQIVTFLKGSIRKRVQSASSCLQLSGLEKGKT
jgi:hypothetical protein